MKLVGYKLLGGTTDEGEDIYVTSSNLTGNAIKTEWTNTFFSASNGTSIMIVGWKNKSNQTYYRKTNYINQPGDSIGGYSIAGQTLTVNSIEPPYYLSFVGNTKFLRCRGLVIDDNMLFKCTTIDELNEAFCFDMCCRDSSNGIIFANPFYTKIPVRKNFKAYFTALQSNDNTVQLNASTPSTLGVLIYKEDKEE